MIRSSGCPNYEKGTHYETRCGDLLKIVWHDGIGLSLYAKRLDRGRFVWPATVSGAIALSAGQLGYLLDHAC
jgi:transposase